MNFLTRTKIKYADISFYLYSIQFQCINEILQDSSIQFIYTINVNSHIFIEIFHIMQV